MPAESVRHHGISFLPQVFERAWGQGIVGPLPLRYGILLGLVLVPPLLASLYLEFVAFRGVRWEEHVGHGLIEGFCAFKSLVLFYILHQEYLYSGNRRLRLMSYGFMAMGMVDLFHAVSEPGSHVFVWFHSTAAFLGSAFLVSSVLVPDQRQAAGHGDLRRSWIATAAVGSALALFGLGSSLLAEWIPTMKTEEGFTVFAGVLNALAAANFFLVGLSFLKEFRRGKEPILFVLAVGMFLFAESQALFPLSRLWDMTWWAWHGIKTGIYMGIMLGLAYEYTLTFKELESSRREKARLHEELLRRHQDLSTLHSVLRDITSTIDLDTVLSLITEKMAKALGIPRVVLYMLDAERRRLRVRAEHHDGGKTTLVGFECDLAAHPFICQALETRAPVRSEAIQADLADSLPEGLLRREVQTRSIRAALYLPMAVKETVLGFIVLPRYGSRPAFTEEEVRLAQAMADQAAVAVEHARLFDQIQRAGEFKEALNQVMMAMSSTRDLQEVLDLVCRESTRLLGVDATLLWLLDSTKRQLIGKALFCHSGEAPITVTQPLEAVAPLFRQVIAEERSVFFNDIPEGKEGLEGLDPRLRARALMAIPVVAREEVLGMMVLIDRREPRRFNQELLGQAEIFARQAAISLETAGLFQELRMAYEIVKATQVSLVESEKLASLGEMAAGIAHEIRNPLGAIANCLGVFRNGSFPPEELAELLDIMEREVDRMNQIVSDTLSFARSRVTQRRPVALPSVVQETLRGFSEKDRGGVVITCDLAPELPLLEGDPHQLQQMTWNLVMNALQALGGAGSLCIRTFREDGWVVLRIEDTGPGIPMAVRGRMFDPFYSTKPDGTGLGLAIVRRIVKEHGGDIAVESRVGTGTQVLVRLPIGAPRGGVVPAEVRRGVP